METVQVNLSSHHYPIYIGRGSLHADNLLPWLAGKQACIVSNNTVAALQLPKLLDCFQSTEITPDVVTLPDGEQYKTLAQWQCIVDTLIEQRHNRDTTLISLGGGVIGDMTGFAASCYQRGVAFIQVPTSLLAQVDASIGGKTAVNHPLGKNMIGAFHQPNAVIIDLETLDTLPDDEFACGMAEVIKAALIADADFYDFLVTEHHRIQAKHEATLTQMIRRACEIKATIVGGDEKEAGSRALLNLGHTFGHALETVVGYGNIKHGQAVAIGLVLAAQLAVHSGLCEDVVLEQTINCLQLYHLPTLLPAGIEAASLLEAMRRDKKVLDKRFRFVLPTALGTAVVTSEYDEAALQEILTIPH